MNYVIWHVVMNRMNTLSQKFADLKREFNKVSFKSIIAIINETVDQFL